MTSIWGLRNLRNIVEKQEKLKNLFTFRLIDRERKRRDDIYFLLKKSEKIIECTPETNTFLESKFVLKYQNWRRASGFQKTSRLTIKGKKIRLEGKIAKHVFDSDASDLFETKTKSVIGRSQKFLEKSTATTEAIEDTNDKSLSIALSEGVQTKSVKKLWSTPICCKSNC